MQKYIVTFKENLQRLDKALTSFLPEKSRTFITKIIDEGHVLVNEKIAKASLKVKIDDVITLEIPEVKPMELSKEDIPLDIVYEDEDILIINKPQGMVVHPSIGHHEHTMVNAILHHCETLSGVNGAIRPGIVHRIDKDTSGLICVAKNDVAHNFLSEQLKDHTMRREYDALLRGVIKENTGTVDMPIGRDPKYRQKMAVNKQGKAAITHFKVLKRLPNHTLVHCSLVTGRTHQIRVHMSHIGYPVEGDPLYGGRHHNKFYDGGQLLCAVKLTLIHPTTKKEMTFNIDLPDYFKEIIEKLS